MRNPFRFRASKDVRIDHERETGKKLSGRQWNKLRKNYQRAVRRAQQEKKG